MKRIDRFFIVLFVCVICLGVISIAEEITLTTYYPAPYGAYQELRTDAHVFNPTNEPDSPTEGMVYYDQADNALYYYDENGDWQQLSGRKFYEVNASMASPSGVWTDWDLSATIPSGATAALIVCQTVSDATSISTGARKNGSSRTTYINITEIGSATWEIELDSQRIVEIFQQNYTTFYCLGYWK